MKHAGRLFGLAALAIGIGFSFIGYSMYGDAGFSLKFLLFMPCIAFLGVGMILFPGPAIHTQQIKAKEKTVQDFFAETPLLTKALWIGMGALGMIVYAYRDEVSALI